MEQTADVTDREQDHGLQEAVTARLRGYAEVARVRRAELRAMTEWQAAEIADEIGQWLPLVTDEPDRGSGLVEQQRLFALVPR